jgi:putative transposase
MVFAALRERIPRSGWMGLLVKPETMLGWHRALVRRKWTAYRRTTAAPTADPSRVPSADLCGWRENPRWGCFQSRGEHFKLGHQVAPTTIRSVLLGAGVPPSRRRSQLT